jgi:cysteine synthase A
VRFRHASDIVLDDLFLDLQGFVPGIRLLLKLEGFNPAGSIKLKTAVALLDDAERRGRLGPGSRVIESSSGNLGIALASVCAARGYAFTCVVDPNTARQSVALMRAFGTEVVLIDRRDGNDGFLHSRIAYIHERLAVDPLLVWPNQYANPANPAAHAARTAVRILAEVPDLDYLFVGAGTTGTLMGCAAHLRRHSPGTRIVAVDAEGSITFGGPPARRHIPGLGTSRRPEILDPGAVDDVVHVAERAAVAMCRRVAVDRGIAVGGSTGSVLAAVAQRAPDLAPGSTVVAIGPDNGDRYLDTVYDDDWVRERFGPRLLPAVAPSAPSVPSIPA